MKPKTEPSAVSLTVIGVDIGKEVFHIVGFGIDGIFADDQPIARNEETHIGKEDGA